MEALTLSMQNLTMTPTNYEQNEMQTPRVEPTLLGAIQARIDEEKKTGNYSAEYGGWYPESVARVHRIQRGKFTGLTRHHRPIDVGYSGGYSYKCDAVIPLLRAEREVLYEQLGLPEKERKTYEACLANWKPCLLWETERQYDFKDWGFILAQWKEMPEVVEVLREFKARVDKNYPKKRKFDLTILITPGFMEVSAMIAIHRGGQVYALEQVCGEILLCSD